MPLTEQPRTESRAFFIETPIPPTRFVDPPAPPTMPRETSPQSRLQYLTAVSVILGICLGLVGILGGLGRAFYVEKDAYTQDKIKLINDLNSVGTSLTKMSTTLDRLEASVSALSAEVKELKEVPARRRGPRD